MEQTILTNMCMITDSTGRVLVQDRLDPRWPGIAFPGGHVEPGESFVRSVIREVWEETGLTISQPQLCGIKQWPTADGARYIVLLFRANRFSGELHGSAEGSVFWADRSELPRMALAKDMHAMLPLFEQAELSEFYYFKQPDGSWGQEIL